MNLEYTQNEKYNPLCSLLIFFCPLSVVDPHAAEWPSADRTLLSPSISGKTTTILLRSFTRCKTIEFIQQHLSSSKK